MAQSIAEVKKWKPRHEIICMMHVSGRQNNEIADYIGVNAQRVSDIINSRRGQARIEALKDQILGGAARKTEEELVLLGPRAVENIRRTIIADVPINTRVKAHQDKVSFELLSRIGYGKKDNVNEGAGQGIHLDRDIQDRIATALEKSNEATKLFDSAEDADFYVEDVGNDATL